MRVTGGRLLRGVLTATALGWAAVELLLALMIVLPTPRILDIPTVVLWLLAVLVEGYSLLLAAFAVLGIALALLAGGDGGVHLPARVLEALACP